MFDHRLFALGKHFEYLTKNYIQLWKEFNSTSLDTKDITSGNHVSDNFPIFISVDFLFALEPNKIAVNTTKTPQVIANMNISSTIPSFLQTPFLKVLHNSHARKCKYDSKLHSNRMLSWSSFSNT